MINIVNVSTTKNKEKGDNAKDSSYDNDQQTQIEAAENNNSHLDQTSNLVIDTDISERRYSNNSSDASSDIFPYVVTTEPPLEMENINFMDNHQSDATGIALRSPIEMPSTNFFGNDLIEQISSKGNSIEYQSLNEKNSDFYFPFTATRDEYDINKSPTRPPLLRSRSSNLSILFAELPSNDLNSDLLQKIDLKDVKSSNDSDNDAAEVISLNDLSFSKDVDTEINTHLAASVADEKRFSFDSIIPGSSFVISSQGERVNPAPIEDLQINASPLSSEDFNDKSNNDDNNISNTTINSDQSNDNTSNNTNNLLSKDGLFSYNAAHGEYSSPVKHSVQRLALPSQTSTRSIISFTSEMSDGTPFSVNSSSSKSKYLYGSLEDHAKLVNDYQTTLISRRSSMDLSHMNVISGSVRRESPIIIKAIPVERMQQIKKVLREAIPVVARKRFKEIEVAAEYASLCVQDAFQGRLSNGLANNSKKSKWIYWIFRVQTSDALLKLVVYSCVVHTLSVFFEPEYQCTVSLILNAFHFCVLLAYAVDIGLKMTYEGVQEYFKHDWQKIYFTVTVMTILDLSCNFCLMYTNFLRPIPGLLRARTGRRFFEILQKMMPGTYRSLVPIIFFIFVMTIISYVLFDAHIEELSDTCLTNYNWFFLIFTNDTFSRLLPPETHKTIIYVTFFLPAVYVGQKFLLSLVIGETYDTYRSYVKKQLKKERLKELQGLTKAFCALDEEKTGWISHISFRECLSKLKPELGREEAALYYELISNGNEHGVSKDISNFSAVLWEVLPVLIETMVFTLIVSYIFGLLGNLLFGQYVETWSTPRQAFVKAQQLSYMVNFVDSMEEVVSVTHLSASLYFIFYLILSLAVSNIALSIIMDLHSKIADSIKSKSKKDNAISANAYFDTVVNKARTRMAASAFNLNFDKITISKFQTSDVRHFISDNTEDHIKLEDIQQCQKYHPKFDLIKHYREETHRHKDLRWDMEFIKYCKENQLYQEVVFELGSTVFEAGLPADHFYLLLEGHVHIFLLEDCKQCILKATNFIGVECLQPSSLYTMTVIPDKDRIKCLEFKRNHLLNGFSEEMTGSIVRAMFRVRQLITSSAKNS
eukprot:gene4275-6054_t